jgi:hypothetical protein
MYGAHPPCAVLLCMAVASCTPVMIPNASMLCQEEVIAFFWFCGDSFLFCHQGNEGGVSVLGCWAGRGGSHAVCWSATGGLVGVLRKPLCMLCHKPAVSIFVEAAQIPVALCSLSGSLDPMSICSLSGVLALKPP